MNDLDIAHAIEANVAAALAEDLGVSLSPPLSLGERANRFAAALSRDLTAQLIPADRAARARLIAREEAVLCGIPWFEACFKALDPRAQVTWLAKEGERIPADAMLCEINGNARAILSAERPALNFLQLLSGTATVTRRYVDAVIGTKAMIMDTRKTLPGLRIAQKYAVQIGGGANQRIGLFDGILIKENHIAAAGGIRAALAAARQQAKPGISIQIEVESLAELEEALDAGAKLILLDNFDTKQIREAVRITAQDATLEASGGITLDNVRAIAATGVDRISIGGLTKHVRAVDLSLRIRS